MADSNDKSSNWEKLKSGVRRWSTVIGTFVSLFLAAGGSLASLPFVTGQQTVIIFVVLLAVSLATIHVFLIGLFGPIRVYLGHLRRNDVEQIEDLDKIASNCDADEISELAELTDENDVQEISGANEAAEHTDLDVGEMTEIVRENDLSELSEMGEISTDHDITPEELRQVAGLLHRVGDRDWDVDKVSSLVDTHEYETLKQFDTETLEILCGSGLTEAREKLNDSDYSPNAILTQDSWNPDGIPLNDLRFRGVAGTSWFGPMEDGKMKMIDLLNEISHVGKGLRFLLVDPDSEAWNKIDPPIDDKERHYGKLKFIDEQMNNKINIKLYRYEPLFRLLFVNDDTLILQNYTARGSEDDQYYYKVPSDKYIFSPFKEMWEETWKSEIGEIPLDKPVVTKQQVREILADNSGSASGSGDEDWNFTIEDNLIRENNHGIEARGRMETAISEESKKFEYSRVYGSRSIQDLNYEPVEVDL